MNRFFPSVIQARLCINHAHFCESGAPIAGDLNAARPLIGPFQPAGITAVIRRGSTVRLDARNCYEGGYDGLNRS